MIHRFLADAVLVLHLGFILFVVLGGLLVLRMPWLAWLHLPTVVWAGLIEFFGWICPLTPLENWLRELGGEPGYAGGFIAHYLTSVIYPDGLTRNHQVLLGTLVVAINLVVYFRLWQRRRGGKGDPAKAD